MPLVSLCKDAVYTPNGSDYKSWWPFQIIHGTGIVTGHFRKLTYVTLPVPCVVSGYGMALSSLSVCLSSPESVISRRNPRTF